MSKPMDAIGQRQLLWELRHAIDRCMRRPWEGAAQQHLERLMRENPRSWHASYVLYNLGPTRRRWLAARGLLPSQPDDSLRSLEVTDDSDH